MMEDWKSNGPVVIGGLGGSGTRVVAEIMESLGFFIGRDLNVANDNLLYTLLFKRPLWYIENRDQHAEIDIGMRLLEKVMLRSSLPTSEEFSYLVRAVQSIRADGFSHRHLGVGRTKWPLKRLRRMITQSPKPDSHYVGWGWKEPNSHLLINDMARNFENFRYIHTVRHGLDMAFSDNQTELHLWGQLFNIEVPEDSLLFPRMSYRFWVEANREAVNHGKKLGNDRFLLLNFDQLCCDPAPELEKLADFLGVTPEGEVFNNLKNLVSPPRSIGRYKKHGREMFEGENLGALEEFGFPPAEGFGSS
jgi:hypothetical protein